MRPTIMRMNQIHLMRRAKHRGDRESGRLNAPCARLFEQRRARAGEEPRPLHLLEEINHLPLAAAHLAPKIDMEGPHLSGCVSTHSQVRCRDSSPEPAWAGLSQQQRRVRAAQSAHLPGLINRALAYFT